MHFQSQMRLSEETFSTGLSLGIVMVCLNHTRAIYIMILIGYFFQRVGMDHAT